MSSKVASSDALRSFRLLEALRKTPDANAPNIQDLVNLLESYPQPYAAGASQADKAAGTTPPLHLAVRVASIAVFPLVLQHRPNDLNIQDRQTGQTPLHLACALARTEIVAILLAQPDIDDMIRDENGKTCLDCAATAEPARLVQVSRATFNEKYLELLGQYISDGSTDELTAWLSKPRARCVDFSAKVPSGSRGTTILHEAARRKDLRLLNLALSLGADVLVKDGRGKVPSDCAKDNEVKNLLKDRASAENKALRNSVHSLNTGNGSTFASSATTGELPTRKGYLSKWTNVAKGGYKQRWFVLQNGHLSYYRHKSDEGQASRGSIAMSSAKVNMSSDDKLKFEISSQIAKYKFYVKADHPLEALRWVEDLKAHADAATRAGATPGSIPSALPTPASEHGDQSSFPFSSSASSSAINLSMTSNSTAAGGATDAAGSHPGIARKISSKWPLKIPHRQASLSKASAPKDSDIGAETMPAVAKTAQQPSVTPSIAPSYDEPDNASILTYAGDEANTHPPHEDNFVLMGNSAKAQIEATQQLLESLSIDTSLPPSIVGSHGGGLDIPQTKQQRPVSISSTSSQSSTGQAEVKDALKQSLGRLGIMLDQYIDMVSDRERYYLAKYEREIQAKSLWEQNMQDIAASHAQLEVQLERTTTKAMARKKELRAYIAGASSPGLERADSPSLQTPTLHSASGAQPTEGLSQTGTPSTVTGNLLPDGRPRRPTLLADDSSVDESDSDDEFFEAIDTGNLPVKVDDSIASPGAKEFPKRLKLEETGKLEQYKGYRNLRTKLPISVDDRPSVSLWGILKNSIGKDLTKISFPVSFNEPTSMLERMAEDMEFSECLDAAVKQEDSTLRLAYVTAFAMSNYSSTIGRIAKPFNPMLGETFEYVSVDRQYRYMSEQVSHHPPMSACICQAPNWNYYGEVDAKSKFLGKSFEIRPTGVAHCKLFLPKEFAPGQEALANGLVPEHYSWKKVTTSVSNFIMGSPTIDHYGDMVVTNHRNGEKCVLTFKPRGWRASAACELKGSVTDAQGNVVWDLAGRWNSQLVARRAGHGSGDLQPDTNADSSKEYVLLWKNSVKPERSPFNLTPYAITLNDKNDELVPYLPPTDCRLRPDLHAFEAGYFEKANDFKTGLEEFQRATRRKRESGELPPHKPRWFTRQVDEDSGERFWQWKLDATSESPEYWEQREIVGEKKKSGAKQEWNDVEHIFGDFELL